MLSKLKKSSRKLFEISTYGCKSLVLLLLIFPIGFLFLVLIEIGEAAVDVGPIFFAALVTFGLVMLCAIIGGFTGLIKDKNKVLALCVIALSSYMLFNFIYGINNWDM